MRGSRATSGGGWPDETDGPAVGLGIQGQTDEDRAYAGSRFREVRDAVFANPYYSVWGASGEPPLPVHAVTLRRTLTGILPGGRKPQFLAAARRTVDSGSDLRWGPDGRGYRRLLHPNGICLTGTWVITEPSEYSGYFAAGSEALAITRYSTCCTETRRGHTRSLSMVGKLYPTSDADHPNRLRTASFITQEDLGGTHTRYVNDADLRNAPDTTAWRRGFGLPVLLLTGLTFMRADREPAIRQLYEIAELGKPSDVPTRAPRFLRMLVDESQPRVDGHAIDFRDEVLAQIYDRGDATPRRQLVFHIEVSDVGSTVGRGVFQRRKIEGWRRIGRLVLDEAVASYNGDHVIHFRHPTWRIDRNDASTAVRVAGKKVR